MGIKRLEWCLHKNCPGGSSEVNIRDLVESATTRKVIVVDGNQFYDRYLYGRWQWKWIYGGILEYVQEIRMFVEKFKEIDAELIFFFESNVSESSKREVWINNRKRNIQYCREVIVSLTKGKVPSRFFGDRLLNIKYLTIYFLRKVMECEVHCSVNLLKDIVIYAVEHNCLAILSQNSYFIMYAATPVYLSFKYLNVETMVTIQYHIDAFREHIQLEQKFIPLLAAIVGDNSLKGTEHPLERARETIKKIILKKNKETLNICYLVIASKFIMKHYEEHDLDNVSKFLVDHFGEESKILTASYDVFKEMFSLERLQPSNSSPASTWQMILDQAQRLYASGEMCSEIYKVLYHNIYEHHTILENFEEIGSSEIYRLLRQQLYGILLHEAPENSQREIAEWCVSEASSHLIVLPAAINLHPGLLSLWDSDNLSHDIQSKRWKMFVDAISPSHNLDYQFFRNLPRNLVVPVAVLFYLQHEVPKHLLCEKRLYTWEVELFIATAMILPKKQKDICKIKISSCTTNVRAIKLISLFLCGSKTIQFLVEACGLESEIESHILHYFDGKLFHDLYKKALQQQDTNFLECEVMFDETFQKIKQMLLSSNTLTLNNS